MIPIILSGGSGTRLWPLSRKQLPKQFLPIIDDKLTLFQSTLKRLDGLDKLDAPIIVCNEEHRFMVAEQLRLLDSKNNGIILEPEGRNTAPAICLAALHASKQSPTSILLVLPADHIIADTNAFHKAIISAQQASLQAHLLTFGITPTSPHTGYGYIQAGEQLLDIETTNTNTNSRTYAVDRFVEKPDKLTAQQYLQSRDYLWNSGMFMFRADIFLEAMALYQPQMLLSCETAMAQLSNDGDFIRPEPANFMACPNISIDYAIMEKASNAAVISLNAGWNDVGAWSAVWEVGNQDAQGNVLRGDVLTHDSTDNLVYAEKRLVSLIGAKHLVVIDTKDVTLVAHKDHVQNIKQLVNQLIEKDRDEATIHREVYRPWGSYDCVDSGDRFQVKRIVVKPGAKLSLQKHHHRAEHWIVVKGTAEVTCDDKTFILTENQSTYIPLGSTHRLSNPGQFALEIIEIQSGSYLGEDDIVRFGDDYGRDK